VVVCWVNEYDMDIFKKFALKRHPKNAAEIELHSVS